MDVKLLAAYGRRIKRRPTALLAAVFLASVLTAPSTDRTNASNVLAAATSVQPVRYVVKRFKQTALGCGSDKQEQCAWIEVTYPLITSGAPALTSTVNPYRDIRHLLRPESGILPFAR